MKVSALSARNALAVPNTGSARYLEVEGPIVIDITLPSLKSTDYAQVGLPNYMLDMVRQLMWVDEDFPDLLVNAIESFGEAFRLVLLFHVRHSFNFADIDCFDPPWEGLVQLCIRLGVCLGGVAYTYELQICQQAEVEQADAPGSVRYHPSGASKRHCHLG